jgi:hypothetical protein
MRFFVEPERGDLSTNFDDAALADRALSMAHLRTDVEGGRGSTTNNSKYNKVHARGPQWSGGPEVAGRGGGAV